MITALLDAFQSPALDASALRGALRVLHIWADQTKRDVHTTTIFHPHLFPALVRAAIRVAADYGLLAP